MRNLLKNAWNFIGSRFNLQDDKAEDRDIIASIRKNVDFRGANLWALIFAIFIASIGLNVNSTAVIIGAMLISPIMGPVMGIGLGIGINDLELVKKGGKNLLVATLISVLTSTLYFTIVPLHEAQSELLARTSPSVWDVFIALFGGLAGMVAASRKEKSNVIPGVAIATALMPPLCTAGFGMAMGNWYYFFGALYLYFINSVFITIATFLMARYLKLHRTVFDDPEIRKKVTRYVLIISLITILPSIYLTYQIAQKGIFETNAKKFVDEQFNFSNTQVVSKYYKYSTKEKQIDLLLVGDVLSAKQIDSLKLHLKDYKLNNVKLSIRQGLNAKQHIDLSQIKASIMEAVFNPKNTPEKKENVPIIVNKDSVVLSEIKALYPAIKTFGTSKVINRGADSLKTDTSVLAVIKTTKLLNNDDKLKVTNFLKVKYQTKKLLLSVVK